ncbi:MAG: ABC transporter permease [Planctomycetota bacterium]
MSLLNLALAYIWHRRLVTALTVASIALSSALILAVIHLHRAATESFRSQSRGFDLIAGAAGSETALVFSTLFLADSARGNIPYRDFFDIQREPGVKAAFPWSLGDQAKGFRVVGTNRAFLEQKGDGATPLFPLFQGRLFDKDLELVAGSEAATRLGLEVGGRVVTSHGAGTEHGDYPYQVVGVLQSTGTALDRGLFTNLGSYWKVHGLPNGDNPSTNAPSEGFGNAEPEITAVLIRVSRPKIFQVQADLSQRLGLMVVQPTQVLQRMFENVLNPIERVLLLYGYAIAIVAASSVLTSLYLATLVRRHDLAILRALGASPREVMSLVFLEAGSLLVLGCGLGVLVSQFGALGLRQGLEGRFGLEMHAFQFTPAEVLSLLGVAALGMIAAILPAMLAYRSDVSWGLRRG